MPGKLFFSVDRGMVQWQNVRNGFFSVERRSVSLDPTNWFAVRCWLHRLASGSVLQLSLKGSDLLHTVVVQLECFH